MVGLVPLRQRTKPNSKRRMRTVAPAVMSPILSGEREKDEDEATRKSAKGVKAVKAVGVVVTMVAITER